MACSCFSHCLGNGDEDIVRPRKTSEPSHMVRVSTSDNKWWKSSGLKAGDQIPVSGKPTDSWLLKRADDNPLWSFHISPTKGRDLYVTYNGNNQNVTLESEIGAGTKKMFTALLQPKNMYMLGDASSTNRFLGIKDGNLAMVDAADAIEWKITDDAFALENQKQVRYIEIRDAGAPARKWITNRVEVNNRVRVNQSATEEWIVSGSAAEASTFQIPRQNYYASRTDESNSKYDVMYESNLGRADLRMFWLVHSRRIPKGAVLLHTPLPDIMYVGNQDVGRDRKLLQLKENKEHATGWLMDVARIDFGKVGQPDIFPPIKTADTGVSV